jgi:hypothetical protein
MSVFVWAPRHFFNTVDYSNPVNSDALMSEELGKVRLDIKNKTSLEEFGPMLVQRITPGDMGFDHRMNLPWLFNFIQRFCTKRDGFKLNSADGLVTPGAADPMSIADKLRDSQLDAIWFPVFLAENANAIIRKELIDALALRPKSWQNWIFRGALERIRAEKTALGPHRVLRSIGGMLQELTYPALLQSRHEALEADDLEFIGEVLDKKRPPTVKNTERIFGLFYPLDWEVNPGKRNGAVAMMLSSWEDAFYERKMSSIEEQERRLSVVARSFLDNKPYSVLYEYIRSERPDLLPRVVFGNITWNDTARRKMLFLHPLLRAHQLYFGVSRWRPDSGGGESRAPLATPLIRLVGSFMSRVKVFRD